MDLRASDSYEEAYPVGPLMEGPQAQMGGVAMGLAMPPPRPAAPQQPAIQRPAVQQSIFQQALVPVPRPISQQPPAIQHQAFQQPIFHPPFAHQPAIQPSLTSQPATQQPLSQQPLAQQPAIQQPVIQLFVPQQPTSRPAHLPCPVLNCGWLNPNNRLDHLRDHLAEKHGYDQAHLDYSIKPEHLGRKKVSVLKGLFVRDARKVAWEKALITAAEEIIQQLDQSYVSCHGLDLSMNCSVNDANSCGQKRPRVTMLVTIREEMKKEGRLYGQPGHVDGSLDEVYEDLVSSYQLDEDMQDAIGQRAEVVYRALQTSIKTTTRPFKLA